MNIKRYNTCCKKISWHLWKPLTAGTFAFEMNFCSFNIFVMSMNKKSLGVCIWQKMTSVRFCKKNCFFVRFQFQKFFFCGFGFFRFGFLNSPVNAILHLGLWPLQYDARKDVLPYWIGPTNCQLKWLRTIIAEICLEENTCVFNPSSSHIRRWTVNETTWKTVPKLPKSVFENWTAAIWVFGFWIMRSVQFNFPQNWYPTFFSGSAHP